ncbi:MAG: ATP-binding cassette domain-containing protein [Acidimicrobiales bacterium]
MGTVLDEIGLPERLLDVETQGLSGGQSSKAALGALLLSRFDLLLLDEPTNNLDFEGLERLEEFLERRTGGLALVSHDRALLSRVVTQVLEIDESTHRAATYSGGWDAYLEAAATTQRHSQERFEAYAAERERLRARERSQRSWATEGVARERRKPRDNDKAQRGFRINRTEKQAAKVRQTERAIGALEQVPKPYVPWHLELDLPSAQRSGELVAVLDGAVVRRGEWRLGPIDLDVRFGDRVALLGPNGSGKTTLLDAVLGRLPLESGSRRLGASVIVGELGQDRRVLAGDSSRGSERTSLLESFLGVTGMKTPDARSLLAKFGLGSSEVERPGSSLSPGERTRAELALLMARGTNCLVLDEPTNHLDLPAIEQLERALGAWTGTLLLVTHDRRLLESVELSSRVELRDGALL